MALQCPANSPFDCVLLDLDDTMYPGGTGIGPALKRNIDEFLIDGFGLAADMAASLRAELFRTHGSTLAGLIALGHDVHPDEYHRYVSARNTRRTQTPTFIPGTNRPLGPLAKSSRS
uniref:Uncharacterized protein n=1 Tax=Avena sativa TaxID=4498 RepID=A0ACD5WTM6_AVESA